MQSLLLRAIDIFVYQFFYYVMLARVLFSWIAPLRYSVLGDIVYGLTEPVLRPIRKMVDKSPLGGNMLDFSPVIAIFLISITASILKELIVILF